MAIKEAHHAFLTHFISKGDQLTAQEIENAALVFVSDSPVSLDTLNASSDDVERMMAKLLSSSIEIDSESESGTRFNMIDEYRIESGAVTVTLNPHYAALIERVGKRDWKSTIKR